MLETTPVEKLAFDTMKKIDHELLQLKPNIIEGIKILDEVVYDFSDNDVSEKYYRIQRMGFSAILSIMQETFYLKPKRFLKYILRSDNIY